MKEKAQSMIAGAWLGWVVLLSFVNQQSEAKSMADYDAICCHWFQLPMHAILIADQGIFSSK
jgi:hypothetical protein